MCVCVYVCMCVSMCLDCIVSYSIGCTLISVPIFIICVMCNESHELNVFMPSQLGPLGHIHTPPHPTSSTVPASPRPILLNPLQCFAFAIIWRHVTFDDYQTLSTHGHNPKPTRDQSPKVLLRSQPKSSIISSTERYSWSLNVSECC